MIAPFYNHIIERQSSISNQDILNDKIINKKIMDTM